MDTMREGVRARGFFKLVIGQRDKNGKVQIVGDSGWRENQITNLGFQDYICAAVGAVAGSKQVSHMALGTGTAPASNGTTLEGATGDRKTTSNSVVASQTMQATAAWASGDHPGGTPTLQNVGLFNVSDAGTILAGNTYSTSEWQSNQGVSATYQLRFLISTYAKNMLGRGVRRGKKRRVCGNGPAGVADRRYCA